MGDDGTRAVLESQNRALRMLGEANQALIRAFDERVLLQQICELIVSIGGYRMAWIGLITAGAPASVRPIAAAGLDVGYLDEVDVQVGDDVANLIAEALRTGRPAIAQEIRRHPWFAAHQDATAARGYLAAVALPLHDEARAIGVLEIYAAVPGAFVAEELAILTALADDIAYGVTALRVRRERDRAAEELRTTERQLGTLLASIPDYISRFDVAGRFTYVSPSVIRATGAEASAIVGRRPREIGVSPDPGENERMEASVARVVATGVAERFEAVFGTRLGPRAFEVRHIPEADDDGRVASVLGIATDLTERRAAEDRLGLLSYAIDHVSEGVFVIEHESARFTYVNESAAEYLGYTREELVGGMTVADIDASWTLEVWSRLVVAARHTGRVVFESTQRTRDGRLLPVEISASWFAHGGRDYHMAVARVIAERRAAERALRASEAAYRTLAENTPDLIVRWNRDLERVLVNRAFAHAIGKDASELVPGRFGTDHAANAADALRRIEAAVRATFVTGEPAVLELAYPTVDGLREFQLRVVPERDGGGEIGTVLGMSRDITALKETEREVRTLTEHLPDMVVRLDLAGRTVYRNPAFDRAVAPGSGAPELLAALAGHAGPVFAGGGALEVQLQVTFFDGAHDLDARLLPEPDDTGAVATVLAIVRDVTTERRAEAALRASEQRFRQVTENIDEVFWLTDVAKTEVIYVSPAYDRVFGHPAAELRADPRAWLARVHPDDRARVALAIADQADGHYDLEYRVVRADGTRWIHERAFPIVDDAGRVYRVAGVAEDVTVRRELEEQLRQAQKMEAVGRLAGGIAHDFNNMLAVIHMQGSLLIEREPISPAVRDGIEEVLAAADRAANLTRQLLTFSRRHVSQPVDLDLGQTVVGLTRLLRRALGEDVALDARVAPALPRVHADPNMIEQVVMNLAINARDAMPSGGRLTIGLDAVTVGAERAALHAAAAGAFLCLTVTDTGCGIAPDALPRIFEPFYTTKEVGKGTGLGLATVFGIVQQHRGWIEVDSTPGTGTQFRVFLPAVVRAAAVHPEAPGPVAVRGGTETILLVEDEAAVRNVARTVLERRGYRVVEAESAEAALAVWRRLGNAVQLLVTDLIMPGGMSGRQLAERILCERPGLPVLYVTGYSPDIIGQTLRLDDTTHLLHKPFGAADLAAAVRRALDRD